MTEKPGLFTAITFEKGPCYGTCPVFTLTVERSGKVVLLQTYPWDWSIEPNFQEWKISKDHIEAIDFYINKYGFRNLKKGSSKWWCTDMASTELTINFKDGITKRTDRYHGAKEWPKRLKTIENHILRLSGVSERLNWDP